MPKSILTKNMKLKLKRMNRRIDSEANAAENYRNLYWNMYGAARKMSSAIDAKDPVSAQAAFQEAADRDDGIWGKFAEDQQEIRIRYRKMKIE